MHSGRKTVNNSPAFPLSLSGPGTYEVVAIQGNCEMTRKLLRLGIQPGHQIELLNEDGRGPLMIGMAGNRFALGRGIAHKIMVRHLHDTGCLV